MSRDLIFQLSLSLHILAAIAAFGPVFIFPVVVNSLRTGAIPQPAALEAIRRVVQYVVIPVGLTMPLTGLAMVWAKQLDLLRTGWLLAAIALYAAAIAYAIVVQLPSVARLARVAIDAGKGGQALHVEPLVQRTKLGGIYLTLSIVAIVLLMVVQPGGKS